MHRRLFALALALAPALGLAPSACKPGGVSEAQRLCARAAAMYDQCEARDGMRAQRWELVIDRWRGLCRAAFTGETDQLLPAGLAIWDGMSDEVKAGLREQAACAASSASCPQYATCDKDPDKEP